MGLFGRRNRDAERNGHPARGQDEHREVDTVRLRPAHSDDGPFSRTSHHQALPLAIAMWFGTTSTTIPIPRAWAASASDSRPVRPPMTSLIRPWSTTS